MLVVGGCPWRRSSDLSAGPWSGSAAPAVVPLLRSVTGPVCQEGAGRMQELERIATRRSELEVLAEELAKQLQEFQAEREELVIAERVLTRVLVDIDHEHARHRVTRHRLLQSSSNRTADCAPSSTATARPSGTRPPARSAWTTQPWRKSRASCAMPWNSVRTRSHSNRPGGTTRARTTTRTTWNCRSSRHLPARGAVTSTKSRPHKRVQAVHRPQLTAPQESQ